MTLISHCCHIISNKELETTSKLQGATCVHGFFLKTAEPSFLNRWLWSNFCSETTRFICVSSLSIFTFLWCESKFIFPKTNQQLLFSHYFLDNYHSKPKDIKNTSFIIFKWCKEHCSSAHYSHSNHMTSSKWADISYATPQYIGILLTFFIIQVTWPFDVWK